MKQSALSLFLLSLLLPASAQDFAVIENVAPQPLIAHAARVAEALSALGTPLTADDMQKLEALKNAPHNDSLGAAIQSLLDPYCIAMLEINPEARVKVARGPADPALTQGAWKTFLVKVHNQSGITSALNVTSPQSAPALHRSTGQPRPKDENLISAGELANRFLELQVYRRRPMTDTLSGLSLEYAIIEAYTNEVGPREVELDFDVGHGEGDLGFRSALTVLFQCRPSVKVTLQIKDFDGKPAMASFIIRDNLERVASTYSATVFPKDYRHSMSQRRPWEHESSTAKRLTGIYPLPARRVAATDEYPDFFFQPQIYRADGEHVYLAPGKYDVTFTRGPEYIPQDRTITVPTDVTEHTERFDLKRWVHMAKKGWYSADHHVHAGGCSHYESPEAGVTPESMFRQGLGEDLNVSCVLTWGPCWYHQKSFFDGKTHPLSTALNLVRYDVEVSGFPSSHTGHIVLLRLKEDDYPNTTEIEQWPSWGMPIMQWAKEQGGVTGYAHSGWGLEPQTPTTELPNYVIPKFDGIGANEFIVTTTNDAVDFISAVDTPATYELNIWYHTLNCGFRTRISGETDFPCIFDDRVGMGRSYAPIEGPLVFESYVEKLKQGANYVSEGKSHIINFKVDDAEMGIKNSELRLDKLKTVRVSAEVSAYLPETQDEVGAAIAAQGILGSPYWDIEKSRIAQSRKVPVEVIVNGYPVAKEEIEADGDFHKLSFEVPIEQSSWVALRVLPSSHTNPIFVVVDGKPVRASRRSAQWCIDSVARCWDQKVKAIRAEEQPAAKAAYDAARESYQRILAESTTD